jgi:hypothetical protein
MRCLSCGANLKLAAVKCEICGAERKLLSPEFLRIEQKFADLREQFQSGNLDINAFQTACIGLEWIDQSGLHWKFNASDQNWYEERADEWVLANPGNKLEKHVDEKSLNSIQVLTISPGSPQKTPGQSQKPTKNWMFVFGCAIILMGVIAIVAAGGFYYLSQSTDILSFRSTGEEIKVTTTPMPLSPTPVVFYTGDGNGFEDLFKPAKSDSYEVGFDDVYYQFKLNGSDIFLTSISNRQFRNLAVDVSVEHMEDEQSTGIAGYIVRASGTNGAGGVLFEIDGNGNWRIERKDQSGERQPVTEWAASDAINTGNEENRIGVVVSDSTLFFLANGVELYSMDNIQGEGAFWGLIGATMENTSSAQIQYRDLRVEEIIDSPVDERPNVMARLGKPDSFCITFEENEDGSISRYEEWSYINHQTIFFFLDGVFMGSEKVDYPIGLVAAPYWYDPFQFSDTTSIEDIKKMIGSDLSEMETPSEFGKDVRLYAGDQILVGLANGSLEYVETFFIETPSEGSTE